MFDIDVQQRNYNMDSLKIVTQDGLFLVHLLGFFAMGIGILSFVSREQNRTRSILGVSAGFWSIHYFMLNAYTSAGIQVVLMSRNFVSQYLKSDKAKHTVFWISTGLISWLCAMTWHDWTSAVPWLAAINSTYALCYLDNRKMRKVMIITSVLWLINGIIWVSWAQIFAEVIKITINMFFTKGITGDINANTVPNMEVAQEVLDNLDIKDDKDDSVSTN